MLEVADIFRLHGAAYRARFGKRLLPRHARAMQDIEACRTAYFGGHVKQCDRCGRKVYAYHSCGNRHCPKCHGDQTERWLEKQRTRLLPCTYYLLTFTLPSDGSCRKTRNIWCPYERCRSSSVRRCARL